MRNYDEQLGELIGKTQSKNAEHVKIPDCGQKQMVINTIYILLFNQQPKSAAQSVPLCRVRRSLMEALCGGCWVP